MVHHLHSLVARALRQVQLQPGDLVIDIGSNDGTLLCGYPVLSQVDFVGIDPTASKFKSFYPSHIALIEDFFSAKLVQDRFGHRKAKVITSIAMFYDLEDPQAFVRQAAELLADDGIWILEQSYLPAMLETQSYDTICHEHLEYYALKQICAIAEQADLKIIDVEFNSTNGGSFAITVARRTSSFKAADSLVAEVLAHETALGLSTLKPYREFREKIERHRLELLEFLGSVHKNGKTIFGYGASTKGNVILQYCGLNPTDLPFIADVNSDKFGSYTPGTRIPIISEAEAHAQRPDYLLVLPWHFRDGIVKREKAFLERGGRLVFPLPKIEQI